MGRVLLLALAGAAALALGLAAWAHLPDAPLPPGTRAERLVIDKAARRLTLYADGRPLKDYRVALGFAPLGHKGREGDGRTPEGRYHIDFKKPDSGFHRALRISYPDAADREAARRRGEDPGGAVMIHGLRNGSGWIGKAHRLRDWTAGCVAVSDREIEELWEAVALGTEVEIRP